MFKRELKYNLKSFLIWCSIAVVSFLFIFLIYPLITSSDNFQNIDAMMNAFPKELLQAFNMDLASMTTVYGWLKSEGFIFVLLIIGCYSGILGSNILLKEESDKTIEYLNSLPITRRNIVLSKSLVGLIYILLLTIAIGFFNLIGLCLSGSFNVREYLFLSLTPLFSSSVIFSFCLFISTFFHKTKKILGVSLAVVLVSYLLQSLSSIDSSVEFLKYFSFFTLADVRNVILNDIINPLMFILSFALTVILITMTLINYQKKSFLS